MTKAIACPNCRTEIEISQVLKTQLTEEIRAEYESKLAAKRNELATAEKEVAAKLADLAKQRDSLNEQVKAGIESERAKLMTAAKKEAMESLRLELNDQQAQLAEVRAKLKSAQDNELALRKKERELETEKEELQLKVARELDAEREKIRQTAQKQFAEEHQLQDAEKQKMIDDMRKQIDDLKRKAEQGSQQTQGEVQELALEEMLKHAFPRDSVEPVGKGFSGADCQQTVYCLTGAKCGSILWESKRTKNYSKSWLPKLRDDQRSARATVAVLVTQVLPEGVETFTQIEGVWICHWKYAKALAAVLRAGLIDLGKAQLASQGRAEKTELVYNYLASQEFSRHVEGIVEAFITMKSDLDSEKRSMKRIWNKREKQIENAFTNTAGMYGDLQGIIGASLPTVEGLGMPSLEHHDLKTAETNTVSSV